MKELVPQEVIESKIFVIRGHKVMLDKDLAVLYGVSTKRLNEQVRRNIKRFPADFMFQLTWDELGSARSQFATLLKIKSRNIKYLPYAFTEQGVAMLSGILHSKRAIQVNIAIMRVFVKLKEMLSDHKEFAYKLAELERKTEKHNGEIYTIFEAIRQLMTPPPEPPKRRIGFHP